MMTRNFKFLSTVALLIGLVFTGCEPPPAPELSNVYDTAYDGGPFDFSLLVLQNSTYQLRWRDNSPGGIDYAVTRFDVFNRQNRADLTVSIEDRFLEDALPGNSDVYEYVFDLNRSEQSTSTNWTIVGFGMESYFQISANDNGASNFGQPVFDAITGDGAKLFIWSQTENRLQTRDISLLPSSLELAQNTDSQPTSHVVSLSPDNRIVCSKPTFEALGVDDIRCWRIETGELIINEARVEGHFISLNRPGYLAIMSANTLEWWRLSDGIQEQVIENIPGIPNEVHPDGMIAFTLETLESANARPVMLSDMSTLQKTILPKSKVFSQNNELIGDCSRFERGVAFYNTAILLNPFDASNGLITTIDAAIDCAFSPDGSQVAIQYNSDATHGISILPVSALSNISTSSSVITEADLFIPHRFDVTDITWTSDNRLFTASDNGIVHEWSFTPTISVPRVDTFSVAW